MSKQIDPARFLCPVADACGGCQMQGLTYEEQLKKKERWVGRNLACFGRISPIIGMEDPYYYRNKVHAAFGIDRKKQIICGIYEANSHRIVPVENCYLEDKKAGEIIQTIKGMLRSFKVKTYDEDTGYGLLRHVLVRTGYQSGQIMVVLVLSSPILPGKNNFIKALREKHPEISTVILNVNDKKTSMILGEREIVLYGKGHIEDVLCGKHFVISPKAFYQVNPVQTEVLYRTAISFAGLTGKETVLDAYCGIGTIGIVASDRCGRVIGVESNPYAVRDAKFNIRANRAEHVEIYCNDAGVFMTDLAAKGEKIDVVFMDPPRAGSDEAFLTSLLRLSPRRIVYISCNPETQARDLKVLTKGGYRVERIQPVDMFPGSSHVETVVQLSKGRWTSSGRPFSADRSGAETISSQNVRVEFSLEDMDMSRFQQGATYEQIQ